MKPNIRDLILQILEEKGTDYVYSLFKQIRDRGLKVRYGTVRWQVLFLTREGLIRPIPPGEAESLGLQVIPNRSGRSGVRPRFARRYYTLA